MTHAATNRMNKTIYTSFSNTLYDTYLGQESLQEVINLIRNDEYKSITSDIKNAPTEKKQRQLKQTRLPVFYPAIVFGPERKVDENSTPTGVVQFDIDPKENPHLDFSLLKDEVVRFPECIYAFMSPRGGLKFGILTDFSHEPDTDASSMQVRFKLAYDRCLDYVSESCGLTFADDSSTRSIVQSCFLSHDPDAFFRDECAVLQVNDQCIAMPKAYPIADSSDVVQVQLALERIPTDLRYQQRTDVNLCVLAMLGAAAIPLL